MKKVVVIGGGTGSYVVASGLRDKPVDVTVLLTMVDDGGSNKVLRDEFGLLPTSGVRQAIVALSENETLLRQLFNYRFHQGGAGLKGMTFGNLFMAAVSDIVGSQQAAIEETCKLLQVKGHILPISYDDVRLFAEYEDGSKVVGEHAIDEPTHDGTMRITKIGTEPEARLDAHAREALLQADLIVIGPGDFYTNTLADLVIAGVRETILKSKAHVCFISNLMTKYGETFNFTLKDFLVEFDRYLPTSRINSILINTNLDYPAEIVALYQKEHSIPVKDTIKQTDLSPKTRIIRTDLLSEGIGTPVKGDALKRSLLRHDSEKVAKKLLTLLGG